MAHDQVLLDCALSLIADGISVIPIDGATKRPTIESWKPYQERVATEQEVRSWYSSGKLKGLARVTGKITKCCVVDCDSEKAKEEMLDHCPDVMETPTISTPRGGVQYYFQYTEGLINRAGYYKDIDVRTDGGYANIPPTENGNGRKYGFLGFDFSTEMIPFPLSLKQYLLNSPNLTKRPDDPAAGVAKGERNQTLAQYIGQLLKRYPGMALDECTDLAYGWNRKNKPPMEVKELERTVRSIWESDVRNNPERHQGSDNDLSSKIREYYNELDTGWFNIRSAYSEIGAKTTDEQRQLRVQFTRFVSRNELIKHPTKRGDYCKPDSTLIVSEWINAESISNSGISFPLDLGSIAKVPWGEIILIGGMSNAGKTAIMMNFIRENIDAFQINYFNSSETGPGRLKELLSKFSDYNAETWVKKVRHLMRDDMTTVHHVLNDPRIPNGRGVIHIIDYLEMNTDFYEIATHLKNIHQNLNGAIAIVAAQQAREGVVLGNKFGLFKPSLAVSLNTTRTPTGTEFKATILKNKLPATGSRTHDGKECTYQIRDGVFFERASFWEYPAK